MPLPTTMEPYNSFEQTNNKLLQSVCNRTSAYPQQVNTRTMRPPNTPCDANQSILNHSLCNLTQSYHPTFNMTTMFNPSRRPQCWEMAQYSSNCNRSTHLILFRSCQYPAGVENNLSEPGYKNVSQSVIEDNVGVK